MVFLEYLVRGVGLFYALGAVFLIRQMVMSEVLDRALNLIQMTHEPGKVVMRRWLLGAGAVFTGASGVAALLFSSWALPTFAVNLALQGGWLVWAARAFPPQDAEDALGRRRTFNAFFFFATMTVTVFALGYEGRLRPWNELQTALPVVAALAGFAIYLVRGLRWPADTDGEHDNEPVDDEDFEPYRDEGPADPADGSGDVRS